MGLPVTEMVQSQRMGNDGCILCGTRVDGYPQKAIRFGFTADGPGR